MGAIVPYLAFLLEKKISINIGYDIRRNLAEDKEDGAA